MRVGNNRLSWWGLAVLSLGMVLLFMNTTMINVALPELSLKLSAGTYELEWIVSAYNLAFVSVLLLGGAVGDRLGYRRTLGCGIVLFLAGGLVAVMSGTTTGLIVARVLMGLGASVFTPMSLALIPRMFPLVQRGLATGIWTASGALGAPLGPLVGGLLIELYGWKGMFIVDVALATLVLILCLWLIPTRHTARERIALPWLQVVMSSVGFSLLTWGLINAEHSWVRASTVVPLFAGTSTLVLFVITDLRSQKTLTDLRLLRHRRFRTPSVVLLLVNFVLFGILFVSPNYLQTVLGNSAVVGGVMLMPLAGSAIIGAILASRLLALPPAQPWALPGALACVALGLWLTSLTSLDSGYQPMLWGLSIAGLGLGLAQSFGISSAMNTVPDDAQGTGAALLNTLRQLGAVVGIALLGSMLGRRYSQGVPSSITHLSDTVNQALTNTIVTAHATLDQLPQGEAKPLKNLVDTAYINAMTTVLGICAVVSLVACLACLIGMLRHTRLR